VDFNSVPFILKVLELLVLDFLEFSILNVNVVFNHFIHGFDVWERAFMVVLDQSLDLHWTLPVDCFDVQAEVAVHESWRSCHRRGAVNVNFGLAVCHQLVQSSRSLKETLK